MKILIVNTTERTGGAAVAANRLMEALNRNGEKAMMLVGKKVTDSLTVAGVGGIWLQRMKFFWERWHILMNLHGNRNNLFKIDTALVGNDITRTKEFKDADVIHLHWINQGMLSLNGLRRIFESGKPVVWTMHDAWPSTAICHYSDGCKAYTNECKNCKLLPHNGSSKDLSNRIWNKKKQLLKGQNISFVTCSKWLETQAKQSQLLRGHYVTSVPNCIDTRTFCKQDKAEMRKKLGLPSGKRLLLFAAQRVDDERKGMKYLFEAIEKLVERHPNVKDNVGIIQLGEQRDEINKQLSLPVYPMGFVGDEETIVSVYNAADILIIPSLEDNLPNTIMEAMACGVPCVGFKTGGIPEMIDHLRNGYVAEQRNTDDLAAGIEWVLYNDNYDDLSHDAIKKTLTAYSQDSVTLKYIEVYHHALAFKRYRL